MYIGFLRNKKTKLYFIIFTIILTFLIVIFGFKNYFVDIKNNIFSDNSIIIIKSNKEYKNDFLKDKKIYDFEQIAILEPDYNSETIIRGDYIVSTPEGVILDSYQSNSTEKKLTWDVLKITGFNFLLVNKEKKLSDNQVLLNVDENFYDYYYDVFENTLKKDIDFNFNNSSKLSFMISDIKKAKWPGVSVSNDKFEELIKAQNNYVYILKTKSKHDANILKKCYENKPNTSVNIETSYNEKDSKYFDKVNKILTIINYVVCFFITSFLIVIFIIFKNIKLDLSKKNYVLIKIGYKNIQVKLLTFIKIISLYFLSIVLSIFSSYIIVKLINYFYDLKLNFFDINSVLLLIGIGTILDFWISIMKKCY